MKVDKAQGIFLFMPAFMEEKDAFGTKIVSVFPRNRERALSTVQGVYILNDPATGEILAVMDGIYLTAVRTGATSAVATKYLSRLDSKVLGIIGTGGQAIQQVQAIRAVRPIREILAYDTEQKTRETFSNLVSEEIKLPISFADSSRDVVLRCDILVTATTSDAPVFDGAYLRPGTHINAIGNHRPEKREIDDLTVKKSLVIVDTYEGCLAESGDLLIPMNQGIFSRQDIHADLGELVTGRKASRTNEDQITLFESVGFALEDLVTAQLAFQKARKAGIGQTFNLEESS
jgi:ornithine cyclodeaminase/alanine dehydrogenase-like protein (mu-crystallin family)